MPSCESPIAQPNSFTPLPIVVSGQASNSSGTPSESESLNVPAWGVSFSPKIYENASFLFEHNSKGFNTGVRLEAYSRLNLMLGVWNLDKPTFSFNYLFY